MNKTREIIVLVALLASVTLAFANIGMAGFTWEATEVHASDLCGILEYHEHTDGHHCWYLDDQVEATCLDDGYQTYVCSFPGCDAVKTHTIPAFDHAWDYWQITIPATCEEDGLQTRVCLNDPAHVETRTTDQLGHRWTDWFVATAPRCEYGGKESCYCLNDSSHEQLRGLDELGHDWGPWQIDVEPTCETAGQEVCICSRDTSHRQVRALAALGHDWGPWQVTRPATTKKEGVETMICARNHAHQQTRPIAKLASKNTTDGNKSIEETATAKTPPPVGGSSGTPSPKTGDGAGDAIRLGLLSILLATIIVIVALRDQRRVCVASALAHRDEP